MQGTFHTERSILFLAKFEEGLLLVGKTYAVQRKLGPSFCFPLHMLFELFEPLQY